jgi:hypothetical protein
MVPVHLFPYTPNAKPRARRKHNKIKGEQVSPRRGNTDFRLGIA